MIKNTFFQIHLIKNQTYLSPMNLGETKLLSFHKYKYPSSRYPVFLQKHIYYIIVKHEYVENKERPFTRTGKMEFYYETLSHHNIQNFYDYIAYQKYLQMGWE